VQSHRLRLKTLFDHANAGLSSTVPALIFGLAVFLFAAHAISQTRLTRDVDAPPHSVAAEQAVPATSFNVGTSLSAPVPTVEEADLAAPLPIPFSALAATEAGSQSSSESSSQSVPAPSTHAATKTKPPHHGLGVALAIVGTAALVSGVALFATEQSIGLCGPSSHGCSEAKDAGLVLMPVGAGVAITGFYLQFHR
jgi:hypothetical protein